MKPAPANAFYTTADHQRRYFHFTAPNDVLVEDLLKPAYWVNVAGQVNPGTLIDVVTQDGLLDVQLRVMRVVDGMVVVHPRLIYEEKHLREVLLQKLARDAAAADGSEVALEVPEGYKIGWNPGKKLFFVQLNATGKKLKEDFQSKVEAIDFANKHKAALNSVSPIGLSKVA